MSEPKFTKGPWKAMGEDVVLMRDEREVVAWVGDIDGQMIANANLIAAAPDMYEALECACDKYCIGYAGDSLVKCEDCVIQKALCKARGEME